MALSHEQLGMQMPAVSEAQPPVATAEVTLKQGEPVSSTEPRSDNVGNPNFAALNARATSAPDTLIVEELHGFSAYKKSGGIFSEGLYDAVMEGVIKLQEPGAREKSKFTTGTQSQIKSFEEKTFLTQVQKDAYSLLREGRLPISQEDRHIVNDPDEFSDRPLFEHILKMPSLESYLFSKQEQSQSLTEAA